jgi:hypothetical protein
MASARVRKIGQFIAQLAIEALDKAVLPRAVRRNEGRPDRLIAQPMHHLGRDKFGAIAGYDMSRISVRL